MARQVSTVSARPPGPVRPVDAASLLIVRGRGARADVLMGRRRRTSSFMPGWYVFPGGRVDPTDFALSAGAQLRPDVATRLDLQARPARAIALAMAAIRETYEETGLMVARPAPARSSAGAGTSGGGLRQAFAKAGLVPAVDALDYIARAITPTSSSKRFNARFFLVAASHAHGRLGGSGELVDLRWVPMNATGGLPVADVTAFVLDQAKRAVGAAVEPGRPVPVLCYVNGTSRILRD